MRHEVAKALSAAFSRNQTVRWNSGAGYDSTDFDELSSSLTSMSSLRSDFDELSRIELRVEDSRIELRVEDGRVEPKAVESSSPKSAAGKQWSLSPCGKSCQENKKSRDINEESREEFKKK